MAVPSSSEVHEQGRESGRDVPSRHREQGGWTGGGQGHGLGSHTGDTGHGQPALGRGRAAEVGWLLTPTMGSEQGQEWFQGGRSGDGLVGMPTRVLCHTSTREETLRGLSSL